MHFPSSGFCWSGNVTKRRRSRDKLAPKTPNALNIFMSYRINFKLPKVINGTESISVCVLVLAKLFQQLGIAWYLQCFWFISGRKIYYVARIWMKQSMLIAHPSLLTVRNTFSTCINFVTLFQHQERKNSNLS